MKPQEEACTVSVPSLAKASPPASVRIDPVAAACAEGHTRFRGLLADASQRDLAALRHLLTCPLCFQLARVVLVELPTLERRRLSRHHS